MATPENDHDWMPDGDRFTAIVNGVKVQVYDDGNAWCFEGRTAHAVAVEVQFGSCAEAQKSAEAWARSQ